LGGLDILVFSGGVGENAAMVRSRICEGLQFMGIELNEEQNQSSAKIISIEKSKVKVYVIPTDEELMIAKMVYRILSN
jgi:acetate kinase